jgi:hypothetical protein
LHFSDQFSYITLCISSYGSKDMIYTRYTHFLEFLVKQEKGTGAFLTERRLATVADWRARGADWTAVPRVELQENAGASSETAGTAGSGYKSWRGLDAKRRDLDLRCFSHPAEPSRSG